LDIDIDGVDDDQFKRLTSIIPSDRVGLE